MEVRKGYKQTEVGVIPEDWILQHVGAITTTVASGRSRADSQLGDYPVHGSTGIIGRCTRSDYSGRAILIARVGANAGKLSVVDGEYGVTDNTIMVKTASSVHMDYFWRQLEAKRLNSMVFGSGQPLITGTQIKSLNIPFPPTMSEQRAIAEMLSDADALIQSLEKLIAKKRDIKQGAMQELLTGKKRLPGFSGEWEEKPLSELADITMGQSPPSQFYNLHGDGLPLVQGNADIENRFTIERVWTTQASKRCDAGDLLLTVRAPVGAVGKATQASCLGRGVCGLKPRWVSGFLFQALVFAEPRWNILEQGSTFTSANSTHVSQFHIDVPVNPNEQEAIVTVLSDMDDEIVALETKLDKYRRIKQGMMQELLTGKTRVI